MAWWPGCDLGNTQQGWGRRRRGGNSGRRNCLCGFQERGALLWSGVGHGEASGQCGGRAGLRGVGVSVQSWEQRGCSCTPAQAWAPSPPTPVPSSWLLCARGHRSAIPRRAEGCAIAGGRPGTDWFQGGLSGTASLSIRWPRLAGWGHQQPGAPIPDLTSVWAALDCCNDT